MPPTPWAAENIFWIWRENLFLRKFGSSFWETLGQVFEKVWSSFRESSGHVFEKVRVNVLGKVRVIFWKNVGRVFAKVMVKFSKYLDQVFEKVEWQKNGLVVRRLLMDCLFEYLAEYLMDICSSSHSCIIRRECWYHGPFLELLLLFSFCSTLSLRWDANQIHAIEHRARVTGFILSHPV